MLGLEAKQQPGLAGTCCLRLEGGRRGVWRWTGDDGAHLEAEAGAESAMW